MKNLSDVLETPEIRRRTQRVLALKEKARQARAGLANIIADLGDELIATKAALYKASDKKTWLRWLSRNVDFTNRSAENYMNVARLRKRFETRFESLARLGEGALYLIAALPERLIQRLIRDPRLLSPKTGKLTPIEDMDVGDIKKALKIYKDGRMPPRPSGPAPQATKEELAADYMRKQRDANEAGRLVAFGTGKLAPDTKRAAMDEEDVGRKVILHWPAWVTPQKHKR